MTVIKMVNRIKMKCKNAKKK